MRLFALVGTTIAFFALLPATPRGAASALGAGGGAGGTLPPAITPPPSALTVPFGGAAPGLADGTVSLRLRLFEASTSGLALPLLVFEETCSVQVKAQAFTARLGACTTGGVPSALVAPTDRLFVRYALEATPDVTLGSTRLGAAAYALTLSPGAVVDGAAGAPALTAVGSGAGLDAVTTGAAGRALVGAATTVSTSGASAGVEGRAASPSGAAGHFVNTGGGDLVVARTGDAASPAFRVTNVGDVLINGALLPQYGPQGAKGPQGDQGIKGPPGNTGTKGPVGDVAPFPDIPVTARGSCLGVCQGPAVLKAEASSNVDANHDNWPDGCVAFANGVTLTWSGADGACCLCGKP